MPNTWVEALSRRGLYMLGCGHMGGAMLESWLRAGLSAADVYIQNQSGQSRFSAQGVAVNGPRPAHPKAVLLAVKPQIMADTIETTKAWAGSDTLYVSVAAGIRLSSFENWLAKNTPIIRAMPNMPVAIGKGVIPLIANAATTDEQRAFVEQMMAPLGTPIWLEDEDQMDAVTAVSGSGPGYVYHMIEAFAAAAMAHGLSEDAAHTMAHATVIGAAALAEQGENATALRESIALKGGTTEAGLNILMNEQQGLSQLMTKTISAAAERSRQMAKDLG